MSNNIIIEKSSSLINSNIEIKPDTPDNFIGKGNQKRQNYNVSNCLSIIAWGCPITSESWGLFKKSSNSIVVSLPKIQWFK